MALTGAASGFGSLIRKDKDTLNDPAGATDSAYGGWINRIVHGGAATGTENDLLGFAPGAQFGVNNDLNRLEVMNANEGGAADDRIGRQLGVVESMVNRVGEDQAVEKAGLDAATRSKRDAEQFERSTRGMDLSPRQKKAASRRLGLARNLNRASAQGATRRGFTDRSQAAASMGGGFADALFGQRAFANTNIASAYMTKKASDAQARADKKSSTLGMVGQVIGGALAFFSSEELKHDHGHEPQLLEKLKKVRVNRWQYKGDKKTHVGPFSEEFNREFGIDTDRPDMINIIDALGVTMGAIKELDKKVSAHG